MMRREGVRRKWTWIALAVVGLLIPASTATVWAGVTGKIAGQVIDKKSRETLIGCAVQIEGTTIGAMTDVDGKYTILAVPPGEHSLRAKLIGHTDVIVHNVLVKPDQTTVVDFEMEQSLVELKPIEVIRKAEMIQMDQATTKRDVTAEKIKTLPVVTVGDILKTQVGVTVRNDRFHIRGGRSSEIIYTVDGVSMTDPLGGRGPTQALNLSGVEIENVSIIKGAWSPEYGGTSGIVNVATKEGDQEVTRGHLQYFTDNFGTASLNKYSYNFNRMEFTIGGPEPLLTRRLLPMLGLDALANKLSYFVSLDFDRSDTYTPINNYTTPETRATYRDLKFLGLLIPDRQNNAGNALVKLTYRLHPDIRMTGIFKRTYERNQQWSWAYRYTPNTLPWVEDKNDAYSLRWTHNLGPSTYYEILLSRYVRTYWQKPGDPSGYGKTRNPDDFLFSEQGDTYLDRNHNGRYDAPEKWVDVYPDGQYDFGDVFYDRDGNGVFDPPNPKSRTNPQGDSLIYDFNGNGQYDQNSGEPFIDRNGNGIWDAGDLLTQDGNGNGQYDPGREVNMYGSDAGKKDPNDIPEPFIDGDQSLGEPFNDVNHNGVWDSSLVGYPLGEPFTDLNYNSRYDGPASPRHPDTDPFDKNIPYRDMNGNGVFDPGVAQPSGSWSTIDTDYRLGYPYYDANGNGRRDGVDGFFDYGYEKDVVWHERKPITNTIKIDLVSQMRREHEVKVGLTYSAYDLFFREIQQPYTHFTGSYAPGDDTMLFRGRGSLRDFYRQSPKTGAFYLVDKMEYGQMVAQVGFRYEYFIQSGSADTSNVEQADTATVKRIQDYRDKFAPRIAFSYPISDKAKVFFNYGHFYQLPALHQMYRRSTQTIGSTATVGNVNLDYAKTIKYEFGLQYMLSPEYLLSVQGFYSDDFGRVNESAQFGVRAGQARNYYENSDYSRARGLEIELEKKYGNYVSGSVTYDFSYAYGKSSADALDYFVNFYRDRGSSRFRIQEFPLDWDERHKVTLILDMRVPAKDHPKLFGLTLPDNFGINLFWQYGSGFPYTPDRSHPGVARTLVPGESPAPNSQRLRPHSNVDLRFNKDFKIAKLDYTFEVWINNLFDTRNIGYVSEYTGRPEMGTNQVGIIYRSNGDPNPRNWDPGRQIRLGVGVNF